MQRQIYWVVKSKRSWGKSPRFWYPRFYNNHGDASRDAMQRNDWEKKHKFKREWYVLRVELTFKGGTSYDVYEHSYKRINK